MKKIVSTIILSIAAISAIVWACSYSFSGLAWFPGFIAATFCAIRIYDINRKEENSARP